MRYHIELRDRDMDFIALLDERVADIRWGFSPVGGCAEFSFRALSKYCTELQFGANFNVRIKKRNDTTKAYDLIYQGRIENVQNDPAYSQEDIVIGGFGYQSALNDIIIDDGDGGDVTYASTEISDIITDLLDNYIVPNTDITYSASDIEDTGFTPSSIVFSGVTAMEAIQKLAEIAGGIDWGVDANRKFSFKAQSDDAGFFYPIGKKIENFRINSSSREIINRVLVIGADVAGSKFRFVKDYAKNQAKYKRRDRIIQNSAVKDNTTAEQLADAEQAIGNGVVDRGSFSLQEERILETTLPVPLFKIMTREITFDEKEFDTFLYAGKDPFRILKISYEVSDEGILSSKVEFGQPFPDIVESVKRLKFSIANVIQSEA